MRNLIQFTKSVVAGTGAKDIGSTGTATTTAASRSRTRSGRSSSAPTASTAPALGIGERVGNAQMELILLNLKLLGQLEDQDLTKLLEYCKTVAEAVGWDVPINYPLVGRDAFRTATGVHAAAIIKAMPKGDAWLADRIYSGVPAGMFGRKQEICIGFMSGASNVNYWLKERGIEPTRRS